MIPFHHALKAFAERRGEAIVIPTMMAVREWAPFTTNEALDFPQIGCMGKASSLGLGLALAQPDRQVIVLDGDGSLLMNLGTLVTIANARPRNLVHCVLENGIYEVTGGQPVPGEGKFDFATMARGAGIPNVYEFSDEEAHLAQIDEILAKPGPTFVVLRVSPVGGFGAPARRRPLQAAQELEALFARTS